MLHCCDLGVVVTIAMLVTTLSTISAAAFLHIDWQLLFGFLLLLLLLLPGLALLGACCWGWVDKLDRMLVHYITASKIDCTSTTGSAIQWPVLIG